MSIWKDFEVTQLFEEVEKCKNDNRAMKEAFAMHATKFGRKPNSVRNYYYFEVENLKKDEKRCKNLKIDLKKHEKCCFEYFNDAQECEVLKEISTLVEKGSSVRSACYKLSNGDLTKMTRLQNKFQNLKKKSISKKVDNEKLTNNSYVDLRFTKDLHSNGELIEQEGKIIRFQDRQKLLSESDINSLFLGLVKLIKKNAIENYSQKQESQTSNVLLKKAYLDLNKKDKQIAHLRQEFQFLKEENEKLHKMINQSKRETLKSHFGKNKIEKLEEES